ncbi:DNA-directed RNA polymerase subunit B'' [Candidatus Woesearchaeota archaeon]|nr:DNA-directed RNA polymerase subunit B'' [Candidatus Woesearchaeota archaeon]
MVKGYKEILQVYFRENGFASANIKSFDNFVEKELPKIVDEIGDIVPTIIPKEVESYVIRLKKIWVEKPIIIEADGSRRILYPSEARLRNLTYSASMFVEVAAYVDDVQRESFTTMIGKLPIMLRSKYCNLFGFKREELIQKGEDPADLGGYFIINGNERILAAVEDLAPNKIFVEASSTGSAEYIGKLFSNFGSYRIPHVFEKMKDGMYVLSFTRFKRVPIISLVKALGILKDNEIKQMILPNEELDSMFVNLFDSVEIKTEEDALEHLAKRIGITQLREIKIERARELLDKYLLPHLGVGPKYRRDKAFNLCKLMGRFILMAEKGLTLPEKDHYMNKRLRLSGDLLGDLLTASFRSLVQDIMYNFQRLVKRGKFQSIKIIIRDELLTSNIKSALATGSWTGGRKGLSQNMDRTNMLATVSHLQRVLSLLTSTQENFAARALHPTHFGRLCPVETPEGTPIGLRKNFSLLNEVTTGEISEDKIKKILVSGGLKQYD